MNLKLSILMVMVIALAAGGPRTARAKNPKTVQAKIGIEILSKDAITRAKPRQIVTPGDRLRIYVHSSKNTNVYVIYTDGKAVSLLNMTYQKIGESTLCLPSAQACYKVDGKSRMERFTIICSPDELPEISDIADTGIPWAQWQVIEKRLSRDSSLILTQEDPDPVIEIAGTVRGRDENIIRDSFVDSLPTYSGKGILVKTYEFRIQ